MKASRHVATPGEHLKCQHLGFSSVLTPILPILPVDNLYVDQYSDISEVLHCQIFESLK